MPLPVEKAADLAKDMAKKGLVGSIDMAKPKMDDEPMDEASMPEDGMEACMRDIDAKVPGLGQLIMELLDRVKHSEPDGDEGSEY